MQRHIKICYILPEYNPETSDHFFHHYELLEELEKKMDIFLIAEKGSRNVGDLVSNIERIYVQKFRFLPLRFLESFFLILGARIRGYKIFYTHYCYIGAINAAIVSRLFGGKSYYWNCAMNWLFKQKTMSGLGYRLSMKLSHYLVTGSEEMKKGYSKNYGLGLNKIKVIPNWINLERFNISSISHNPAAAGDRTPDKNILFVHWLSKRKGADMITPIIKGLVSNPKSDLSADKAGARNPKLIVVGEGPYKDKLEKEIKENKLKKHIEVIGAVPNKNLPEYYAKADVFIMPSMEEGFPRVLLEAMAMNIPYVASDVGAVKEMSPEIAQRFLVKPGDIEMFVHKLEILLTDKKIYEQFRKEELEKVKEYSLEKVIEKFINLFK